MPLPNNNPNEGVGRGMKVAKEQIVGMVAAVDWILSQTDEGLDKGNPVTRLAVIASMVKGHSQCEDECPSFPEIANHFSSTSWSGIRPGP